jgi:hypothetical protein
MRDYWDVITLKISEYWIEFNIWLSSLSDGQIAFYTAIPASLVSIIGYFLWRIQRKKEAKQQALDKQEKAAQDEQQHQEKLALQRQLAEQQAPQNTVKPTTPFPTTANPDYFIGRDDLLNTVHQRLQQQHTLLLVNGLGGIGKTAVAQIYFNRYQQHYNACAWVFVGDGLRRGMIAQLQKPLGIQFDSNQPIAEQFFQLIAALQHYQQQYSGRHLLVLDNADDSEALIQFKADLQKTGWSVLISSRCSPDEYEPYLVPIKELSPKDAASLFHHHYPLTGDLQPLLEKIYYHTLLIELLAKAGRKKGLSLVQLLASLDKGIDDKALQRIIYVGSHADSQQREKKTQLYRYLLAIFEPDALPKPQLQLLINFSVLPAEDIPLNHLEQLFTFNTQNSFEDDLEALFQTGWLSKKSNADGIFYKMHALVQDIVFAKQQIKA